MQPHKCSVRVPSGAFTSHQCHNDAIPPSDKCGVHNDAAVARRQLEREEKWRKDCAINNARNAALVAAQAKLEAYDKLVMFALLVKIESPAWDKARKKLLKELGESLATRRPKGKTNG
jgi:hypothetical protein